MKSDVIWIPNVVDGPDIPVVRLHWKRCYRIIPTQYPRIDLYERIADKKEWPLLEALESLTNPRLQIKKAHPSSSAENFIDASFAHRAQGRFTNGTFGACYVAKEFLTALAEVVHHRTVFLKATSQPPLELGHNVLIMNLKGKLHDVRALREKWPSLYRLNDYEESQRVGAHLKEQGSEGIVYRTVRRKIGECAGIFERSLLQHCRQERHLIFRWDGTDITPFELQEFPIEGFPPA